jgi:hypothetical protein
MIPCMTTPTHWIAYEKGTYLPLRHGEPLEHRGEGRAHAVKASFSADAPEEPRAVCGAPVSFLPLDAAWPPVGLARCPACSAQLD